MKNDILSNYLQHLNEQGRFAGFLSKQAAPFKSGAAFKKNVVGQWGNKAKKIKGFGLKSGIKTGGIWTLLITPVLWTGWRSATAMFSQAHKRCGTFSFGPGRKLCIIREKTKALRQKINILNSAKSQNSNKAINPSQYKASIDGEINKVLMKIDNLQSQYESLTNTQLKEAKELQNEQSIVSGLFAILGMIVVDKALFMAWRTVKATYSKDLRRCGIYKNKEEFKVCMYSSQLTALLKKQALLRKVYGECPKQKNPQKCQEKVTKEIQELDVRLQRARDNLLISKKAFADKKAAANEKAKEEAWRKRQK